MVTGLPPHEADLFQELVYPAMNNCNRRYYNTLVKERLADWMQLKDKTLYEPDLLPFKSLPLKSPNPWNVSSDQGTPTELEDSIVEGLKTLDMLGIRHIMNCIEPFMVRISYSNKPARKAIIDIPGYIKHFFTCTHFKHKSLFNSLKPLCFYLVVFCCFYHNLSQYFFLKTIFQNVTFYASDTKDCQKPPANTMTQIKVYLSTCFLITSYMYCFLQKKKKKKKK
jgi:hypothetical protein